MTQSTYLQLHPEAVQAFNAESELLIAEVRPVSRNKEGVQDFQPEVFVSENFAEGDVIGEIEVGIVDGGGNEVGKLFRHNGQQFGLVGEGFQKLRSMVDKIQGTQSFRNTVSQNCVLKVAFEWIRKKYRQETTISLCEYVIDECSKELREMEIWVPIYKVHAEEDFAVGSCLFRTITAPMLGEWEQHFRSMVKESEPRIDEKFRADRKQMQGTLAASFKIYAEPDRGYQLALERAERAIGLLNFFHPAHGTLRTRSYAALLGQEDIQTTTALVLENGRIRGRQRGLLDQGAAPWVLDRVYIQFLKGSGLDKVGALSEKEKKSDYDTYLLNALLLYSKSSLSTVVTERLVYIFAALESMLLKNTSEPVQKNIGERLAFLTRKTAEERRRVAQVVEEVYKLRSSFLHHGEKVNESEVIEEFMRCAWKSFIVLIAESEKFHTRSVMFDALDNMKFS
jgi:hypothetical protein